MIRRLGAHPQTNTWPHRFVDICKEPKRRAPRSERQLGSFWTCSDRWSNNAEIWQLKPLPLPLHLQRSQSSPDACEDLSGLKRNSWQCTPAASCQAFSVTIYCWLTDTMSPARTRRLQQETDVSQQRCRDVSTRHMAGLALCHRVEMGVDSVRVRALWEEVRPFHTARYVQHVHPYSLYYVVPIHYKWKCAHHVFKAQVCFLMGCLRTCALSDPGPQNSLRIKLQWCISRRLRHIMSIMSARMILHHMQRKELGGIHTCVWRKTQTHGAARNASWQSAVIASSVSIVLSNIYVLQRI